MTAAAIKQDISQLLSETEDALLLEEIKAIFLFAQQKTDEPYYFEGISTGENALIRKGLDDIENGRTSSHQEVRKDIDQILKR
jgi:predicted transcriptional regulator